ncbi:MAG: pentapeptide repeat-containing protein, partial [Proteobacteria bacterium]|nr:pentapeptide repeat-containing protein [Pseudomonadota bacterium]
IDLNRIRFNGINLNGIDLNGIDLNGIDLNGINLNGINLNQLRINGIDVNGINLNRIRFNGINLNGINLNGINLNGINLNGINLNDIELDGVALGRQRLDRIELDDIRVDQIRFDGIDLDGVGLGDITLHRIDLRRVRLDGEEIGDDELDDVKRVWRDLVECALSSDQCAEIIGPDGSSEQYCGIDGTAPTWKSAMLSSGAAEAATAQCVMNRAEARGRDVSYRNLEAETVERVFSHMIACALPSDRCVGITGIDGSRQTHCGESGLDPGWETGPPDPAMAHAVADCVIQGIDQAGESWLDYIDNFKLVLSYAVSCALPQEESAMLIDENSDPWGLSGSLGLAPWWQDRALDDVPDGFPADTGQKRISACLAARTNALARPVVISLRSPEIATSPVERQIYDHSEGAFWANLFGDDPYVNTCIASGGGPAGRICADGYCSFTHKGDCATVCSSRDGVDEHYVDCDGEVAVVTTFLNLGEGSTFGQDHACARKSDDSLWCWGKGGEGQLGNGQGSDSHIAVAVDTLGHEVAENNGTRHHCARKSNGSLWCWGRNRHGQLGDGSRTRRTSPVQVATLDNDVMSFGTHRDHTCAVKSDGTLWCWGKNQNGELGDGTTRTRTLPVEITALGRNVGRVSHGHGRNTCSVKNNGTVWCSGQNHRGQCGNGARSTRERIPVEVVRGHTGLALDGITEVCTGLNHACGRRYDNTVWCWGDNRRGQLGHGIAVKQSNTAVAVSLRGVEPVPGGLACGHSHTCTLAQDGSVWCWGYNKHGELGNGTLQPRRQYGVPTRVIGLHRSVAGITAGRHYTCAIFGNQTAQCWGQTATMIFTELGAPTPMPVEVELDR